MTHSKAALAILACAITSCGGAAEPAKMAETATTPDAALRALEAAEAEVAVALGARAPQGYAQPPAEPPPPPVAPQPAQSPQAGVPGVSHGGDVRRNLEIQDRERDAVRVATGACMTACAALASMSRAADHLCSLAGPADGRCQSARERVKGATARVTAACPKCAR